MVSYDKVCCPRCKSRHFYTRSRKRNGENKFVSVEKEQVCIKCGLTGDFYNHWEKLLNPKPKDLKEE